MLRQAWLSSLDKKCTPEFLRAEDGTGQLLSSLVEDDSFYNRFHVFRQGGTDQTLEDILHQVVKCETDTWEGVMVWADPKAIQAALQEQKLEMTVMTVEDFEQQGSGEEVFILLYHHVHCVPCWSPEFFGPFASRPWIERLSVEGFAPPFEQACAKYGWHCDLTTRASGDCGFHAGVVYEIPLAKHLVPRSRPKVCFKASKALVEEALPLQDLFEEVA